MSVLFGVRSLVVAGAISGAIALYEYYPFGSPQDTASRLDAAAPEVRLNDESPAVQEPVNPPGFDAPSLLGIRQAKADVRNVSHPGGGSSSMKASCNKVWGCAAVISALTLAPVEAKASPDLTSELANAICAAPSPDAVSAAVASFEAQDGLTSEDIAEAFGIATFLADLGRCADRQAIADGFAFYKKGKDPGPLDAAFASGRVAAKPEGGTASTEVYQGSFAALGAAGDPPSGQ